MFKRKKRIFKRSLLNTNEILVEPIAKISEDLSKTRIRSLTIRVDEFSVEGTRLPKSAIKMLDDDWGNVNINFDTQSFRKDKKKNVILTADVEFKGKRNHKYKVYVKIFTSAYCVNNYYDMVMHQYAYCYMRQLLGYSKTLERLGYDDCLLRDIDTDLLTRRNYDGYVLSAQLKSDGHIIDHNKTYETTELTEKEIKEDPNNKVIVEFFDKHKNDKTEKQMYIQAIADEEGKKNE